MTLAVDVGYVAGPLLVQHRQTNHRRTSTEDPASVQEATSKPVVAVAFYNRKGCESLLEDPAIGLWASEAASDYGVTAADALELLAYALFLDGGK
jgi:hypothetical protein